MGIGEVTVKFLLIRLSGYHDFFGLSLSVCFRLNEIVATYESNESIYLANKLLHSFNLRTSRQRSFLLERA